MIDFLIQLYNFLWENEVVIVFLLVLLLWMAVRGFDVFRWLFRKLFHKKKRVNEGE